MPRSDERIRIVHPYAWLWEPLEVDPTFVLRTMFGAKAVYLGGKLMLCFCASEEPWHGVLVCTERIHHDSLRTEFSALVPHTILPKWLYLPNAHPQFEAQAERLVKAVRQYDSRIGVEPKARKRSSPRATRKRKPARMDKGVVKERSAKRRKTR